jgi:hypothetical protein
MSNTDAGSQVLAETESSSELWPFNALPPVLVRILGGAILRVKKTKVSILYFLTLRTPRLLLGTSVDPEVAYQ